MKILVIGNCQSRPLSELIGQCCEAEVLPPVVLNLVKADDDGHNALIDEADIILAQKTADNFHIPALRSSRLQALNKKVLIWPNIFWAAEQPFVRYVTHQDHGRMLGPLEALHDLRIFARWLEDAGLVTGMSAQFDDSFSAAVAAKSFESLRAREEGCDVIISDFVAEHAGTTRMFFTFNHPMRLVLVKLVERILAVLGLPSPGFSDDGPEPLGRYIVPSQWSGRQDHFLGDSFVLESDGSIGIQPGAPVRYTEEELEVAFLRTYDHCPHFRDLTKLRFTPALAAIPLTLRSALF